MESKVTSNEKTIPDEIKVRILAVNWNENIIGYLMKENSGNYFFKYDDKGIQEARKNGYPYIIGFKDTRKTIYWCDFFWQIYTRNFKSKKKINK